MLRARESKNKLGDKGETALVNQSALASAGCGF